MSQPLSREMQNPESSPYAFTVATSHRDQSSEASDCMDPEFETRIKYFEPSILGMKELLQMKQRSGDFLQDQCTAQDMEEAFHQIVAAVNPSWYSSEVVDGWIRDSPHFPKSEGMSDDDANGCSMANSLFSGPSIGGDGRDCIAKEDFDGWNPNLLFLRRFLEFAFVSTYYPARDVPYAILTSFLFKAHNSLPTYSGKCVRALDLSPEEETLYKEGKILAWKSFNSSSMGENPPSYFERKNARFIIYSRTGRLIAPFSNHPDENEVLFAPGCTFMVVKKEIKDGITFIYLREVELGITEKTILCFDEKIEEKNWEHKEAFDKLRSQEHKHGISIISKSSEAQASAFLESPFGQEILKVVTILQGLPEKKVVSVATLVELFKNPNFNVEPPFSNWLVQTRDEARESFYRREETECMDFNLQKKLAVRYGHIQGDLDSNEPLLSTSMALENSNAIDQINLDNFSSPTSVDWNMNSGIQPDELMNQWSGGMKAQAFIIEGFNEYS